MHEFFNFNCMTTANRIMANANRQHYLAIEEAHARQIGREAAREYRKLRYEKALDTALLVATIAGTAVVTAFFCGLAAC